MIGTIWWSSMGKAYDERNNFVDLWLLGRCHNRWKLARKRKQWSVFFSESIIRTETKILLYRTPSDIVQHKEKALGEKEVAGFIHMEPLIEVRKTPLVANPSPFVLDATKATLKIIEEEHWSHLLMTLPIPSMHLSGTDQSVTTTTGSWVAGAIMATMAIMDWRRTLIKGEVILPRFSPQFVNGDTRGTPQHRPGV